MSREEMSRSFGAAAAVYESGRPEYPVEAVTWMLEPVAAAGRSIRVADVGAGTGKLTRAVAVAGAQVVAIDPDPAMLAQLREGVPGVPTFVGTAERMPLPDAALDAVLLGQAWHWGDPDQGAVECARVLRSGGVLGLVWNIRDESLAWVRRLTAIMHDSRAEVMLAEGPPPVGSPFPGLEEREWRWVRSMTRAELMAMVGSRSYVLTAAPAERARIDQGIAALFDELGATGEATVDLPYVTRAFRGIRP